MPKLGTCILYNGWPLQIWTKLKLPYLRLNVTSESMKYRWNSQTLGYNRPSVQHDRRRNKRATRGEHCGRCEIILAHLRACVSMTEGIWEISCRSFESAQPPWYISCLVIAQISAMDPVWGRMWSVVLTRCAGIVDCCQIRS